MTAFLKINPIRTGLKLVSLLTLVLAPLPAVAELRIDITQGNGANTKVNKETNFNSTAYNLVHGSDSPESAAFEIALYFEDNEIIEYERSLDSWLISEDDS